MWGKLRRYFLSGLVIFLPLSLTIYLFILTISFADGFLSRFIEPVFQREFGFYFRGISIIVCVWLITLIGFFATNYLGWRVHAVFESLLIKLPFFRQVYPAIKEMARFLFLREKNTFKQVVLVEYPRKGIYSVGFLTNDAVKSLSEKVKKDLVSVFMPSSPGPLTGFIIFVPKGEMIPSDMHVEDAVKMIVSGGVVIPNK